MLCNFFGSVVKSIKHFTWPYIYWDSIYIYEILIYKFYLSIVSSKQNVCDTEKFSFRFET